MATAIYLTLLAINIIVTLAVFFATEHVTKKQLVTNIVFNTAAAAFGTIMPTWLLITLTVMMTASLAYALYALITYSGLLIKKNVIEEELTVSDLDPEDPLHASIIEAWERAQRD